MYHILLLYSICCIVSFYLHFSLSFVGYVDRRLVKYVIVTSLFSEGWQESFGMVMSVAVGLLYMLNIILLSSLEMFISRKLIASSDSSFVLKFIVGFKLLSILKILDIRCTALVDYENVMNAPEIDNYTMFHKNFKYLNIINIS